MILADTPETETAALDELLEVQRADFEEVLEAMDGLPVTVRLLDPPLHEFLPSIEELAVEAAQGRAGPGGPRAARPRPASGRSRTRCSGLRGVRLGIVKDGLYKMQVRALMEAALTRKDKGGHPIIEIMIPLVVTLAELELARRWIEEAIEEMLGDRVGEFDVTIGTMIETPRAAVRGDEIAEAADFFSFGTNDLTQMTWGFSRDDVAPILEKYLEEGILKNDPFETIDTLGVGELVRQGVDGGRADQARPQDRRVR